VAGAADAFPAMTTAEASATPATKEPNKRARMRSFLSPDKFI
jgi:hypothetical protein